MLRDIGPMELMIILLIALLLFGAERLPDIARSTGRALVEFKHAVRGADEKRDDSGDDQAQAKSHDAVPEGGER